MNILNVKTMGDLKSFGKLVDVRKQVTNQLDDNIKIKSKTWVDLFESIQSLRKLNDIFLDNVCTESPSNPQYFKGDAERIIYILLELDGKTRLDKLGVSKIHFSKKSVADNWRNEISKLIHPDVCKHPNASNAMAELNEMYKDMIK